MADSYTVEGVQVDVTADNAIKARDQAFAEAQQEAFKELAARFLSPAAAAAFQPPDAAEISPMIKDYEVTQEKLSSTRYIGTYSFQFKPRFVTNYFGHAALAQDTGNGAAPVSADNGSVMTQPDAAPENASADNRDDSAGLVNQNAPAGSLLILPFYKIGRATSLWSSDNDWMMAWRRANPPPTQVVPIGDLSDAQDIGDDQALSYEPANLSRMLVRYNAREAAIIIATPDGDFARGGADTAPAYGTLHIALYRADRRDGPEQTGEISVTANTGETRAQAFDRAALLAQRTLGSQWKNTSYVAPSRSAANVIDMRVPFGNLQQWAAARRILDSIQGVNDVVLKSLSPREARIGVVYNGNADALRISLQQAGMDLSQGAADGFGPQVYDLIINASGAAQPPAYVPMTQPQAGQENYKRNTEGSAPGYAPHYPPPAMPPASYVNTF